MNWESIAVLLAVVVPVVGAATGYLHLFVSNALHALEQRLYEFIENRYVRKEVFDLRQREWEQRLTRLEGAR